MFNVYNHNHTLLGEFETKPEADREAAFYIEQTGNAAFVSQAPNPTQYIRKISQHPKNKQRIKFVVCYPSTKTAVAAFDTLKAARHYAENMVIEGFPWDFPARTAIPIISRETIEKYKQRIAPVAA